MRSFLTSSGAGDFASDETLGGVFDATVDVDFLAAGGRSEVVDNVISGPCSMALVLSGCDGVVVVASCVGLVAGALVAAVVR